MYVGQPQAGQRAKNIRYRRRRREEEHDKQPGQRSSRTPVGQESMPSCVTDTVDPGEGYGIKRRSGLGHGDDRDPQEVEEHDAGRSGIVRMKAF